MIRSLLERQPPQPPEHGPEVRALATAVRAYLSDPHAEVGSPAWRQHRAALAAALNGLEGPLRRHNAWLLERDGFVWP